MLVPATSDAADVCTLSYSYQDCHTAKGKRRGFGVGWTGCAGACACAQGHARVRTASSFLRSSRAFCRAFFLRNWPWMLPAAFEFWFSSLNCLRCLRPLWMAWILACENRLGRISAPFPSCRSPQAALKFSYRSDRVTRD